VAPDTQTVTAAAPEHPVDAPPFLHHHFDDLEQQRETTSIGMWAFLATEAMMFGGLFLAYTVYRLLYPGAFFEGSRHLNVYAGTANTFVLLFSSYWMARAVHAATEKNRRRLLVYLALTFILAAGFLVIKGFEWTADYHEGTMPAVRWTYYLEPQHHAETDNLARQGVLPEQVQMFMVLYFCMVGLHGIHVLVGMIIMAVLFWYAWKGDLTNGNDQPVELSGLYWHFVDIIWVFLYPLYYLIAGFRR
jgi:cytochrome c oxidase subunit III